MRVQYYRQWRCVISSFITKPQRNWLKVIAAIRCVISSFITKPQPASLAHVSCERCVISSFITKPQLRAVVSTRIEVALYPLSSPNHNAHMFSVVAILLRYILFHHQTTTTLAGVFHYESCVISSFITKPQPIMIAWLLSSVALYPLSSPNHNCVMKTIRTQVSDLEFKPFEHTL